MSTTLPFSTAIARGLADEKKMQEFEKALKNVKWDIIGKAGIKWGSLMKRRNGNYITYLLQSELTFFIIQKKQLSGHHINPWRYKQLGSN